MLSGGFRPILYPYGLASLCFIRLLTLCPVQLYPIKLLPTSQFETLLEGIIINVDEGAGWNDDEREPVWKHIALNKNITIINEIEVSRNIYTKLRLLRLTICVIGIEWDVVSH